MGTEIVFSDLLPFVENGLKAKWRDAWIEKTLERVEQDPDMKKFKDLKSKLLKGLNDGEINWDLTALIDVMHACRDILASKKTVGHFNQIRSVLKDIRNETMHNDALSHKDGVRALDIMMLFTQAIKVYAGEEWETLRRRVESSLSEVVDTETHTREKKKGAKYYFNYGIARQVLEGNQRAIIEDYTDAIEIDPNYGPAYIGRGIAKEHLRDYQGAIQDFTDAIKLKSTNYSRIYFNRGIAKEHLRDYQGAIQDYTEAISLKSDYALAYNNRGVTQVVLGNYQEAIKDYTKAIEIDPNYATAYYNRGLTKVEKGDYQGAIEDFTQAIDLNPNFAYAYYNRGLAKRSLGDYQGAEQDFAMAKKLKNEE